MEIILSNNATVANPGSLLKPDLRYSQGYLIPWVQLEMGIFLSNNATMANSDSSLNSSQTSGIVKDWVQPGIHCLKWNKASKANPGSPLKPDLRY
jgi:hypothetical protein